MKRPEKAPGEPAPGALNRAAGTSTRYSIAQEFPFVYKNFWKIAAAAPPAGPGED